MSEQQQAGRDAAADMKIVDDIHFGSIFARSFAKGLISEAQAQRDRADATERENARLTAELAKVTEERDRLKQDSGNYRGACGECGTANMDMLTDSHCAECELRKARAENERLRMLLTQALRIMDAGERFGDWTGSVELETNVARVLAGEEAK